MAEKQDYHFEPSQEFPWRIDLCLSDDGSIVFSGASAELNRDDAIKQGYILLNRFMAKKAILTPIIVDKRLDKESIDLKVRRLTTILEKKECLQSSKKPSNLETLSNLMSSLKKYLDSIYHNFLKIKEVILNR